MPSPYPRRYAKGLSLYPSVHADGPVEFYGGKRFTERRGLMDRPAYLWWREGGKH